MKNIKFGLIALAAVVAGTGSAYAVSASTEAYTAEAISISAEPISIEDAAQMTETSQTASRIPLRRLTVCPRCTRIQSGGSRRGECRSRGRRFQCTPR